MLLGEGAGGEKVGEAEGMAGEKERQSGWREGMLTLGPFHYHYLIARLCMQSYVCQLS